MNMNPGDVSEPVRTPTGFHIVRLDGTRGGDSGPVMVEQLHARHVLMRPNEVQDDATTRQRLSAIRDRILAGEDFAALASVTSEDPGSASRGGDLGWTSPGTFDPAFEEVLARLQPDEISEPFRTQFGWHIVQLLGRRTYDQSDELRRQRVRDGAAREQGRRGNRAVAEATARRGLRRDQESLIARARSSSRPASPPASGLTSRSPRPSPTGPPNSSLRAIPSCLRRAPPGSACRSCRPNGARTRRRCRTGPEPCPC